MEDRGNDTTETSDPEQPPGSISNQNAEEPPGPDQSGGSAADRDPSRRPTEDSGSAKEGSQATGHPENAG